MNFENLIIDLFYLIFSEFLFYDNFLNLCLVNKSTRLKLLKKPFLKREYKKLFLITRQKIPQVFLKLSINYKNYLSVSCFMNSIKLNYPDDNLNLELYKKTDNSKCKKYHYDISIVLCCIAGQNLNDVPKSAKSPEVCELSVNERKSMKIEVVMKTFDYLFTYPKLLGLKKFRKRTTQKFTEFLKLNDENTNFCSKTRAKLKKKKEEVQKVLTYIQTFCKDDEICI